MAVNPVAMPAADDSDVSLAPYLALQPIIVQGDGMRLGYDVPPVPVVT